jgi:hypothetical protein
LLVADFADVLSLDWSSLPSSARMPQHLAGKNFPFRLEICFQPVILVVTENFAPHAGARIATIATKFFDN